MTLEFSDARARDILKKLIAHMESAEAIGNLAEAEAFAGKVAELFEKYSLTRDDLVDPVIGVEVVDPIFYRLTTKFTRVNWYLHLATAVAEANATRVLFTDKKYKNTNELFFIGLPQDRHKAASTFVHLARLAQSLSRASRSAFRKSGGEVKHFTDSFTAAFVDALIRRFELAKADAPIEDINRFITDTYGSCRKDENVPLEKPRVNDDGKAQGYHSGLNIKIGGVA